MNKLVTFLKSIPSMINKYDVEADLGNSLDLLDDVIGMYKSTSEITATGDFNVPENKKYISNFYKRIRKTPPKGVNLTVNDSFLIDMVKILTNIRENGEAIKLHLRNYKTNTISPTSMSIEQATILRAVPHYHYISRYAASLINLFTARGIKIISKVDTNIPKKIVDDIDSGIDTFVALLSGYGRDNTIFAKALDTLPGEILSTDGNAHVDNFVSEFSYDLVPGVVNGFIGSPIYTVRSIIATWQADRYHEAVDTRTLYQLRLNYMKSLTEDPNNIDSSIEEEIEILQNKVTKLTAKIDKMEKSIQ